MKNIDIIAKTATTTAATTAAQGVKIIAAAAPVAVIGTMAINKLTTGVCDAKAAVIGVTKAAVTAIAVTTIVNTAVATTAVAIGAAKAKSEEDGDVLVEDFDDWDDEEDNIPINSMEACKETMEACKEACKTGLSSVDPLL